MLRRSNFDSDEEYAAAVSVAREENIRTLRGQLAASRWPSDRNRIRARLSYWEHRQEKLDDARLFRESMATKHIGEDMKCQICGAVFKRRAYNNKYCRECSMDRGRQIKAKKCRENQDNAGVATTP